MNIETFFEARDLYDRYQLCEKVMEYMSDEESAKGQKYLETLRQFAEAFKMEFMTFVHERMEAVGLQFEDLHCPEHSEQPDVPAPPSGEEKEPKFPIGSLVEVISGIGKGDKGVVERYDPTIDRYYVVSDKFYMWFAEEQLTAYTEEPEHAPSVRDFAVNDRVEIIAGGLAGKKGTVVGIDAESNLLDVLIDGDEESTMLTPTEIKKTTDENGGGDTEPAEGE